MGTMRKPLLKRRTFWKGAAAGAAAMAALIMGSVVAVSLAAPEELSRGVRPTWEPTPVYAGLSKPDHVTLPPCDTRGKDCVVFDDRPVITFEAPTYSPFEAPSRTVPEPSTLWLIGLAGVVMARNTLFAAATVAFVTLGRWLGMREEDE
jgi:anaerobic selenocysteine-containing dehydrogenase